MTKLTPYLEFPEPLWAHDHKGSKLLSLFCLPSTGVDRIWFCWEHHFLGKKGKIFSNHKEEKSLYCQVYFTQNFIIVTQHPAYHIYLLFFLDGSKIILSVKNRTID